MYGEKLFHFHQFGFVGSGGGFDFEDVDAGAAGGEVDAVGDKGKGLALAEGVDGYTMQPVSSWNDASWIVGCITVNVGDVRLIDNITLKQ